MKIPTSTVPTARTSSYTPQHSNIERSARTSVGDIRNSTSEIKAEYGRLTGGSTLSSSEIQENH